MNQQDLTIILDAILKLQANEWIPVVSALGGALVGGLVTFFPTKYLEDRKQKQFALQVRNCIIAEVSALIRVIENRKYVKAIEEAVDHLRNNPTDTYTLEADIPIHYSQIYQAQCQNLGVLDRTVARDIISFYQLVDAVVQDIKPEGTFSKHPSLEAYLESLEMFRLAVKIGKSLDRL
ncbi:MULTISPECIES: hypothetical protein [unclassified Vibrio]|uniref:hypothetical protein n=1 Tax=unclassified Vibrio TaxID=2614977 RepID=UPI001268CF3E|nr:MULTISPECIES: hypothetical protein [unclassified Vibrio]QFT39669.1 hypothetical protein FIU99_25115 [Vibrio sp. THAF64]QGM37824.1 hypothetical protein GGC04_26365 [Vibrio sp. THAF191d]QGN73167.1 hypothetical protein GGC03_25590 [Vibrio sp. THAF191c]